MKPEISEEVISGWRREFKEHLKNIYKSNFDDIEIDSHWTSELRSFLFAKTSSHERILEIQGESDNHNKSFLNMFEQNEEKAKRILELENENSRLKSFCNEFVYGEENPNYYKTMQEKLTKRDELLRRAEKIINTDNPDEFFSSTVYSWNEDFKELK